MFGELLCALSRCQCFSKTRYHPGRIFSRHSSGYPPPIPESDKIGPKPISLTQRLPPTPLRRGGKSKQARLSEPVEPNNTLEAVEEQPSQTRKYPPPVQETNEVGPEPKSSTQSLLSTPPHQAELIKQFRLPGTVNPSKTIEALEEQSSRPRLPAGSSVVPSNLLTERSRGFTAFDSQQRNSCHKPFSEADKIECKPIS